MECLKDLEPSHFESAVLEIVKEVREFYPGTNPVAVIRDKAKKYEGYANATKQIEGRR